MKLSKKDSTYHFSWSSFANAFSPGYMDRTSALLSFSDDRRG